MTDPRPPQPRPLPGRASLRYLKLEAKRRLAAGEFPALHDAQLVIAREHGASSWTALKQLIGHHGADGPVGPAGTASESHAIAQLRWMAARFRDAGRPGWTAPDDEEMRQHFIAEFLDGRPPGQLRDTITRYAAVMSDDLVVLTRTPLTARVAIAGLQVFVSAEPAPPHRITGLWAVPGGRRVTDPRAAGQAPVRAVGDVPEWAAHAIEEALAELGAAGLVLAGGGPDTLPWVITAGWADLDGRESLHTGHRFPGPGITGLVTATAVLRLIADGRVGIDEPANDSLRSVRLADDTVTVRELLCHTAGADSSMPVPWIADSARDLADMTGPDRVITCDGPRGEFLPSNCGYAVLGQLIADVTGQSYAQAATALVLAPLAMTRSGFPASLADLTPDAVTGYELTPEGTFVSPPGRIITLPAVGGLWATAGDIVRLGAGWASLLPRTLARQALMPQTVPGRSGYAGGLGWLLTPRGDIAVHSGAVPGAAAALLCRVPDGQVHVTMATRQVPLDAITRRILRARATRPSSAPTPNPPGYTARIGV